MAQSTLPEQPSRNDQHKKCNENWKQLKNHKARGKKLSVVQSSEVNSNSLVYNVYGEQTVTSFSIYTKLYANWKRLFDDDNSLNACVKFKWKSTSVPMIIIIKMHGEYSVQRRGVSSDLSIDGTACSRENSDQFCSSIGSSK